MMILLLDAPDGTWSQLMVTLMRRSAVTVPCDALISIHWASGVIEKSKGVWPRLKMSIQRDCRLNESKEMVGGVVWVASKAADSPSTATAIEAGWGTVISWTAGILFRDGSCQVV